jgi:PIN domain nuclease of toxin-antitoxin system
MTALLLDTCAIIFIAERRSIAADARRAVRLAGVDGEVLVSPVSAWEIGLLTAKRGIRFAPSPKMWFGTFLSSPGVQLTPLTPDVAIDSCVLPEPLHGDPADRLLIATARFLGVPIVTRDRRILDYAAVGHVGAIAC